MSNCDKNDSFLWPVCIRTSACTMAAEIAECGGLVAMEAQL